MSDLIPLYDFQLDGYIQSTEHSIMLLKVNAKDSVTNAIIQFLERDLAHFKATVERRKEVANV